MKREASTIAKNKKAFHEYDILETYEAGIELTGTEVRSLRENHCQLTDCFALVRDGEVWLATWPTPTPTASASSCCTSGRSAFCASR